MIGTLDADIAWPNKTHLLNRNGSTRIPAPVAAQQAQLHLSNAAPLLFCVVYNFAFLLSLEPSHTSAK